MFYHKFFFNFVISTYVRFLQRGHICQDPTQCDLVLGIDLDAMSYFHFFSFFKQKLLGKQSNRFGYEIRNNIYLASKMHSSKFVQRSIVSSKQYMGFEEMQKRRKRELVCFSLVFFWLNFFLFCEKGANICQIFLSLQK